MDDSFLDLLSKAQSERLDDQRTDFHPSSHPCGPSEASSHSSQVSSEEEELLDTLWRLQGCRIEEQRCEMPSNIKLVTVPAAQQRWQDGEAECVSSDELFDLIFASQVKLLEWPRVLGIEWLSVRGSKGCYVKSWLAAACLEKVGLLADT